METIGWFRRTVFAGTVFWMAVSCCRGELILAENGHPRAMIVTGDVPSAAAVRAADDLQMWLERISGAVVPVFRESDVPESADGVPILVGDTRRTRQLGLIPEDFQLEEIVVQTFPDALVITGDDARPDGVPLAGTELAVSAFVEQVLGVRMLWPGPLGEIVPQQETVRIGDVRIRDAPALIGRSMGNHAFNGVTHIYIDALGWDRDPYRRFAEEADLWFRFHRPGGSHTGNYSHAFGDYWDRFHEDHPDWFALQPDGTRDNSQPETDGYPSHRLCVSSPGLIRQVAQDAITALQNNPTLDAVSVSPNDGGLQTFCLCDRCESWDAPDGQIVQMRSRQGPIPHVSFSDRYARFYSEVAKIVAAQCPGRHIGAYAYSVYSLAPKRETLHPAVIIGFVHGSKIYFNEDKRRQARDNWLQWSQRCRKLHVYSNGLMGLHALPTVIVHRLAEDMRFYADHGMLMALFDCHFHHWATNGLNYYVAVKLLWDPYLDVDQLIDDYCRAGFGPAAPAVRRWFEELERISDAIAAENRRPDADTVARHYSDAALARLSGLLDEAAQAAGADAQVADRIRFLRQGLDYAPICRDYLVTKAAAEAGNKWDRRRHTAAAVRRTLFFGRLGPTRVIHAPWLLYQDW